MRNDRDKRTFAQNDLKRSVIDAFTLLARQFRAVDSVRGSNFPKPGLAQKISMLKDHEGARNV